MNFLKKYIILLSLFIFIPFGYTQEKSNDGFYAIVTNIKSQNGTPPLLFYDENNSIEIKLNDKISPGATILTSDDQTLEIIIYKVDKAYGIILIKENTDFKFQFNNLKTILDVRVIYGGIRGVIDEGIVTSINSETIKSAIYGADFGLISIINKKGKRTGYSIVFGGELLMASRKNLDNSEIVEEFQICKFIDNKIFEPRNFNMQEFNTWKKNMLFQSNNIPPNLNLILETLDFNEIFKVESQVEEVESIEEDKTSKFDYKKFLAAILSFEAGTLNYDKNIGIKCVWRPGASFLGDKFEFGLYIPVNFIPSRSFTKQPFFNVNGYNNEWSFGSDQNSNAPAIVFDVFDDILLKMRIIRYNHINEKIFLQSGQYNNVSDFLQYSLVDFNSHVFYPKYRKTSFITIFNLPWFKGFVYAEDVMPKGLYGTDLQFMTPAKSFRFKYRISAFMDCYNLINFSKQESFFPAQFNNTFNFDAFNVPSLGFSLFLSGGIFIPFSYNFDTGSSLFQTLVSKNPGAIAVNISCSTGFSLRILDFELSCESYLDSGLNKIGLFDTFYFATRDARSLILAYWMSSKTTEAISIDDFNFGFRVRTKYSFKEHIIVELSYQLTLSTVTRIVQYYGMHVSGYRYYDKLYFKLSLDSVDKWKVNFSLFILWQAQVLGITFTSPTNFQLGNLIYTGLKIKPHKGIDINLAAGIYPDYITFSDPWYSQFMFDFSIAIKPLPFFEIKGEEKTKINL